MWPGGQRCSTSCIKTFASGTALALRAAPAKGWKLAVFRDDSRSCKKAARCTIHLRDNDDVFVSFVRA